MQARQQLFSIVALLSLQGGFAKCYELLDLNTNKVYAGKIISKQRLTKPHQRQKVCILTLISSPIQHNPEYMQSSTCF